MTQHQDQPDSREGGWPSDSLRAVCAALHARCPPIKPLDHYWLMSDASASYCYPCARKAVAAEMEIVDTGEPTSRWDMEEEDRDTEELFRDAIDGGYGYSGESDVTASCETCGATLAYTLTDYGVRDELAAAEDDEIVWVLNGETSYWFDRLDCALSWGDQAELIARAVAIGNRLLSLATTPTDLGLDKKLGSERCNGTASDAQSVRPDRGDA